jgi:biotin carboxyl carrier protein
MNLKIKTKNKEYDISIDGSEEADKIKISIDGKDFIFDMGESVVKEVSIPQTSLPKANVDQKEIRASLSGTISDVFVKEGDIVKAGQKLLALSAMKMENEIVSEIDGKVKKVAVGKDQKVKEGELLIALS